MKSDVKQINKEFRQTLIAFIGVIILMGAVAVAAALFIPEAYSYIVYFLLLISFILIGPRYRTKMERITNVAYIIKIRANQAEPLPIKHMHPQVDLYQWLVNKGYQRFISTTSHEFYFREQKDPIRKVFKKYIVDVVVFVHTKNNDFYLSEVDDEVQKVIDQMIKDKKRLFAMTITQIKRISKIDEQMKDKLTEIVFIRSKRGIISTINVGLHDASKQAVMLYSKTYSPSLYYTYHIDQIKEIV